MTQAGLWTGAGVAACVAVAAGAAEWWGSRRSNLDRVALVPWGTVSLLAFLAAVIGLALALKA